MSDYSRKASTVKTSPTDSNKKPPTSPKDNNLHQSAPCGTIFHPQRNNNKPGPPVTQPHKRLPTHINNQKSNHSNTLNESAGATSPVLTPLNVVANAPASALTFFTVIPNTRTHSSQHETSQGERHHTKATPLTHSSHT